MLVLSRKKNESIVINDDITVLVVEIRGDKVRLGVEAPKETSVHRREIYDAIQRGESKPVTPLNQDSNNFNKYLSSGNYQSAIELVSSGYKPNEAQMKIIEGKGIILNRLEKLVKGEE